ncbi:hypothetical protein SHLO109777_01935 [Shewanella loihica]|uniref:hypothetical protein n=1 Tax=Shewanella loihica TaxID=359303 RepID=UPI000A043698|nr:hypothetical protein [Shewanella loihica]
MKKQRPTIPVGTWKLATNLEATRQIQGQAGVPAYKCDCEWCTKWRHCFSEVLPNDLLDQLSRIGIELEAPTDLYRYDSDENGFSIRVVYHAVGKILEGPTQWTSNDMGEMLMYSTLREDPHLSLVVFPQSQSHDAGPSFKTKKEGDLIRIDMRLKVPS